MTEEVFYKNTQLHLVPCTSIIKVKIVEYRISNYKIKIGFDENDELRYCIDPIIEEPQEIINTHRVEDDKTSDATLTTDDVENIEKLVEEKLAGYRELKVLIEDEDVEEIAATRHDQPIAIIHRKMPLGWIKTNILLNENDLDELVIFLSRRAGRNISIAHPYVEGLLPEGHRLAATYAREISRYGSSFVIRKHISKPITPPMLIRNRVISLLALAYLWQAIQEKKTILIVGPTAAGKTTLLQSLLLLLPPYRRVVTVEDTPELNLSYHDNWDSLVTRHTYALSEGEDVDLYKLMKFALRRRADYIVIGEIRGEEAQLLSYASTSGHGVMATFHAETSEAALSRLMSDPFNLKKGQLASISVIVVIRKINLPNSLLEFRRVVEISEIVYRRGDLSVINVFKHNVVTDRIEPTVLEGLVERTFHFKDYRDEIDFKLKILNNIIDKIEFNEFYNYIRKYYSAGVLKIVNEAIAKENS